MADSPFQLLQINQQVTSDAFGRIDRAMSESFQLAENARQFDTKIEQRATEFAAEMAFSDRQLQAQTAHNIHMAEVHKFGAELDLRRFEAERELDGERKEIAKINLEVAKANQQRALVQGKQQQMNQLTNPYDIKVAGMLANNKSADFGNEYLSIKSKYLGQVGAGKPFDENAFRAEVDTVIQKYQGVEGGSEYDPAVATLMDSMGAMAEATRYRSQNPVFSGSVPGLKARMLLGDPDTFAKDIAVYGGMLKPEEQAQIAVVRNSLVGFNQTIQQQVRRLSDLTRQASSIHDDPKALEENKQQQLEVSREIQDLEKRKNDLFNKTVGFNIDPVEEPTSTVKRAADNLLNTAKSEVSAGSAVAPSARGSSTFNPNAVANAAEANIGVYTQQFPEAFANLGFKDYAGVNLRNGIGHVESIRNQIINNLEFMPIDSDEANGDEQTIEKLVGSKAFAEVFANLKDNAVPVPLIRDDSSSEGWWGDALSRVVGRKSSIVTFIGDRNAVQSTSQTGGFGYDELEIDSVDDVKKLIREFRGSSEAKRDFVQQIYASVVAAGVINQFSQGKK